MERILQLVTAIRVVFYSQRLTDEVECNLMPAVSSTAEEALLANVVEIIGFAYGRGCAGKFSVLTIGLQLTGLAQGVQHRD